MIAVLALLAGMAVLSLIHELGHAIAAVLFGMHITDVCIGLGPPLLSMDRRGVRFFIAPVPIGGFVRVAELSPDPSHQAEAGRVEAGRVEAGRVEAGRVEAGRVEAGRVEAGRVEAGQTGAGQTGAGRAEGGPAEGGPAESGPADAEDGSSGPSFLARALVVAAGPAANCLFAGALALAMALGWGIETGKSKGLRVAGTDAGAARAGLVAGDLVSQINGRKVRDLRSLSEALAATDLNDNAVVEVERHGRIVRLSMPRLRSLAGGFGLGASYLLEPDRRRVAPAEALVHAAKAPLVETTALTSEAAAWLWAKSPAQSRPLGIVGLADRVYAEKSWTAERVLQLAISLSVAMGLFNLLPFPGLDGGRLCLEVVQGCLRRRLPGRSMVAVQLAGGLVLLAAWLLLTAFEICHL